MSVPTILPFDALRNLVAAQAKPETRIDKLNEIVALLHLAPFFGSSKSVGQLRSVQSHLFTMRTDWAFKSSFIAHGWQIPWISSPRLLALWQTTHFTTTVLSGDELLSLHGRTRF